MQSKLQNGFPKSIQLLFDLFIHIVFSSNLTVFKDNLTSPLTLVYSTVLSSLKKSGTLFILLLKTTILIENRQFVGKLNKKQQSMDLKELLIAIYMERPTFRLQLKIKTSNSTAGSLFILLLCNSRSQKKEIKFQQKY